MLLISRFHDVLFDTHSFVDVLFKELSSEQFTEEVLRKAFSPLFTKESFHFLEAVKRIARDAGVAPKEFEEQVHRVIRAMDLQEFIYPDWTQCVTALSKETSTLRTIIVVHGEVGFEKILLERAGLKHAFDDIFYADMAPSKVLGDVMEKYPEQLVVYCDTLHHELDQVAKMYPDVFACAVERGGDMPLKEKCPVDVCVQGFSGVREAVKERFISSL